MCERQNSFAGRRFAPFKSTHTTTTTDDDDAHQYEKGPKNKRTLSSMARFTSRTVPRQSSPPRGLPPVGIFFVRFFARFLVVNGCKATRSRSDHARSRNRGGIFWAVLKDLMTKVLLLSVRQRWCCSSSGCCCCCSSSSSSSLQRRRTTPLSSSLFFFFLLLLLWKTREEEPCRDLLRCTTSSLFFFFFFFFS